MGGETASRPWTGSYPRLATGPVGKKIHNIYTNRLRMFTDNGQYYDDGLLAKLYQGKIKGEPHIKLSVYSPPNLDRPTFKEATSHTFTRTNTGAEFGPSWSTHWFKVQITLPDSLANKPHLEFHWDADNEGLVWSEHGEPLQGLTGKGERVEWIIPSEFRDGREHTFYVEMACNGMFGVGKNGDDIQPPDMDRYFKLKQAEVVAVNLQARALKTDFWIISDAAREFPEDSWEEHEALTVANEIMDCFLAGKGTDACIKECRQIASKYLGNKVDSAAVYDGDEGDLVYGIGQCHIDTCWLWPWAETKRKVARSWANQCNLMDRYSEHRFAVSQAQQYKWLKMYYPTLYDRVKSKVNQGVFQPVGGSWVEHDTNMPSGESLVRQFLLGQRFFQSHFGERCKTFWLPDTFGYSSQLPQICRGAGMSRFFTQKLSWNNINNFPHTTFNWVALDGSQVICHMAPSETYTADANFGDVKRSITQHKSMDQDASSLLVFGKGDGGGGPTWEMLEKLRRCRGMSDKVGRLPRVKMGDSVEDFFDRLEKKAENGTQFVTWYGELYFELHRGTYTTQSNNKRNNRKAEVMMHDVEYLATIASLQDTISGTKTGYKYPKEAIDDAWEAICLCQFHDCLPGSSIEMCYDDSNELYAKVFKSGEKMLADALTSMGFIDINSKLGTPVAINTLPWSRPEILSIPNGEDAGSYSTTTGDLGVSEFTTSPITSSAAVSVKEIHTDVFELENTHFRVTISGGVMTSIYDKAASREVVPPGQKANQLVIFDDKPLYWQAWDVEVYHLDSRTELTPSTTSITEQSAYLCSVTTATKISEKSSIRTTVSLRAAHPGQPEKITPIEITADVVWHEDKKFLKVEFPVDVRNTSASYETQYGIVTRPTHYNTTWDMAKFEVCCHKWADLSESSYGVSILNDCKYGFATQGNVMRLSLLRAPKAPDAHADMGTHHFKYAILPHTGPLDYRTVRAGVEFNNPIATPQRSLSLVDKVEGLGLGDGGKGEMKSADQPTSLFPYTTLPSYIYRHVDPASIAALMSSIRLSPTSAPAIILDTIKRGEDDEDVSRGDLPVRQGRSVILRLYDSLGGRAKGRVELGELGRKGGVKGVRRCNLLEDDEGAQVEVKDNGFDIELRAFEVGTWRVMLK